MDLRRNGMAELDPDELGRQVWLVELEAVGSPSAVA